MEQVSFTHKRSIKPPKHQHTTLVRFKINIRLLASLLWYLTVFVFKQSSEYLAIPQIIANSTTGKQEGARKEQEH